MLDNSCAVVADRTEHPRSEISASPASSRTTQTAERWFVLYVRSRQEKALADDLSAMGISHYLPLVRQSKYYGKRKMSVELPLFPGYVFVHGSTDEVYLADRTKRVARIITVADQSRIDWELRNIRLALGQNAVLSPYPFLVAGTRVVVQSGPLCGLEGIIEHRGKGERLILQVEMLGQATSVEIDGAQLARLD